VHVSRRGWPFARLLPAAPKPTIRP
jgi:hypothetical protein